MSTQTSKQEHPLQAVARRALARLHRVEIGRTTGESTRCDLGVRATVRLRASLDTAVSGEARDESAAWKAAIFKIAELALTQRDEAIAIANGCAEDALEADLFVAKSEGRAP